MQSHALPGRLAALVLALSPIVAHAQSEGAVEVAPRNSALDSPEAASAILAHLAGAGTGPLDLPVIAAADPSGTKWVRALTSHPDWPVGLPFAAQMGFVCGDDGYDRVGEPGCWRRLDGDAPGPAGQDAG